MSYRKRCLACFLDVAGRRRFTFGEIDIMEYIDCWSSKEYQINVHVTDKKWESYKKMNPQLVKADVSKFHIYTLEWYKDKLVFLLDGNLCYQFDKRKEKLGLLISHIT